jgi:hypothetical protein
MNHYQLAQAHRHDLLRAAAQHRLAAQARRARASRRHDTTATPSRRLARLWQRPATP